MNLHKYLIIGDIYRCVKNFNFIYMFLLTAFIYLALNLFFIYGKFFEEEGFVPAIYKFGEMIYFGNGVTKDEVYGWSLISSAASKGFEPAVLFISQNK